MGEPGRLAKPGIPFADTGLACTPSSPSWPPLVDRQRTGEGTVIEIGMFDVVTDLVSWAMNYTCYTGVERQPNGMSSAMVSPYGAYPTRDGATVLLGTTNDAEGQRLALRMFDRPDLAGDPLLSTNDQRCEARARLHGVIGGWTAERRLTDILECAEVGRYRGALREHSAQSLGALVVEELVNLTETLAWEQSRVSHHLARMQKRGLLRRQGCDEHRHSAVFFLTDTGRSIIEQAAPSHVAEVRRLLIDHLSRDQVEQLAALTTRALAALTLTERVPSPVVPS